MIAAACFSGCGSLQSTEQSLAAAFTCRVLSACPGLLAWCVIDIQQPAAVSSLMVNTVEEEGGGREGEFRRFYD